MKGVVHVLSFFALAGAGGVFVGELKDHVSHIAAWSFLAMVALSLILALTSGSPEDGS